MKEGHDHEVRRDLVVGRRAEERLAVLAPEGEEGVEQAAGVETAVVREPCGLDLRERRPDRERELADDDL
ncbi:hypothetical protein predicted by Glimmer/Critica [Sorangium cellulosum So ce56]|uniref:Uncharacterized protein n=1 Tax=Sorangium cellulosum (strain So ce56) TaxID=448385 RepID=A9FRH9_SORC5|nr:hypothetical protein predicted by Glimmer/Critica [Sorangium cellulosum So ce56]